MATVTHTAPTALCAAARVAPGARRAPPRPLLEEPARRWRACGDALG